jgi:hyperosmotically inducible protein
MKHVALVAVGLMVAACAHDERPVAPSASTVDQATNVPTNNPDFTPPENKVGEVTDAEGRTQGAAPSTGTTSTASDGTTSSGSSATQATTTPGSSAPQRTTGAPGSSTTSSNAAPTGTATAAATPTRADNSGVNTRDRDGSSLTPMDQGESEADRTITQQIRQAVMKDGSLSFTAKNVKIITINRKVTLRGAVKSDAERASIEAAARKVAGVTSVENDLEVAK